MKKLFIPALIVFSVSFFTAALHGGNDNGWVVRINNDTITSAELDEFYYAHHRQLFHQMENTTTQSNENIDARARNKSMVKRFPTLDKKLFLQELINQRLLVNQAVAEGYKNKTEVISLLKMAESTTLVQYFLFTRFKDDIAVSDTEVKEFYDQNQQRFPNTPIEKVSPKIRQFLSMQKMRQKIMVYLNNLRESARIERNAKATVNR